VAQEKRSIYSTMKRLYIQSLYVVLIFLLLLTKSRAQGIDALFSMSNGGVSGTKDSLVNPGTNLITWKKTACIVGITTGLYTIDQEIQDYVREHRGTSVGTITDYANQFGNGKITFPILGVLYLYGRLSKNKKTEVTSFLCIKSFLIAGGITQILKCTGHRHRPNSGDPYNTWDGPGLYFSDLSFPSGHASVAWAVASVIAFEYKHVRYVSPIAYIVASLTSFARVYKDAHWASDAFFGSVLGYYSAKFTIREYYGNKNRNVALYPYAGNKEYRMVLSFNF